MWKARKEALENQLQSDLFFASNPFNRNRAVYAAGEEAKYIERVEILMRGG